MKEEIKRLKRSNLTYQLNAEFRYDQVKQMHKTINHLRSAIMIHKEEISFRPGQICDADRELWKIIETKPGE